MALTQAEQILSDLVAIPSVSENRAANDAVLDYVGQFLGGLGMHVQRLSYTEVVGDRPAIDYGALVATTLPENKPKVMLSAHCDVVPGPDKLFKLRVQGDKLLGRGVIDMKGEIAAFLVTMSDLHARGVLHERSVGITITSNEEIGGQNTKHVIGDGFTGEVVLLPDAAANWCIERTAKGAWTIRARAEGKTAHGSRPWEGDSATWRLTDLIDELKKRFKNQGPDTDTLNISILSGGEAQNQLPDRAEATFDFRTLSEKRRRLIQAFVEKLCAKHRITWRLIANFPSLQHDLSNPYTKAYRQSVRAIVGVECQEVVSPGASDAAYYAAHDIPVVLSRPKGGNQHSDDEHLSRKGLEQYIQVLGHFIETVCKVD